MKSDEQQCSGQVGGNGDGVDLLASLLVLPAAVGSARPSSSLEGN